MKKIFPTRKRKDQADAFIGTVLKDGRSFGIDEDGLVLGRRLPKGRLASWDDLSRRDSTSKIVSTAEMVQPRIIGGYRTLKFGLTMLVVVFVAVLYVRHIYTTRALLREVTQLRKTNLELNLQNNRLKANYENIKFKDGKNSSKHPTELIKKAKELNLQEGWAFGETIYVKDPIVE
jgi:hypothetical protein